jgi:excisionase family DNA binding protein
MNHERQKNQFKKREPSPIPPSIQPILVGVDEAASALRVGRTMIYALMLKGILPYVKIGKRRLVAVSALNALAVRLSSQEVTE